MSFAFAKSLAARLYHDQHGFIVSAELVLVATITVLGMVVGLSEVALNVNNEIEDVGSAFASMSQGYTASGLCGHKGHTSGSKFKDVADFCDGAKDIQVGGTQGEH